MTSAVESSSATGTSGESDFGSKRRSEQAAQGLGAAEGDRGSSLLLRSEGIRRSVRYWVGIHRAGSSRDEMHFSPGSILRDEREDTGICKPGVSEPGVFVRLSGSGDEEVPQPKLYEAVV